MISAAVIYSLRLRHDPYDPEHPTPILNIHALCVRDETEPEAAFN